MVFVPIEPAPLLEFAESHPDWQNEVHSSGLVQAGLSALARWLEKSKCSGNNCRYGGLSRRTAMIGLRPYNYCYCRN